MNKTKMYPLSFNPILKSILWGGDQITIYKGLTPQSGIGESWEISGVKDNISIVENGSFAGKELQYLLENYGEELVGKKNYQRFGDEFPLLIKFIDAKDDLSIQVHPDDSLAWQRHQSKGKTEMWYVMNAAPGARLYSGFQQPITPEEYEKRVQNNTITQVLSEHQAQQGDLYFLPAGRVHAIGGGLMIAEIQQTSNITYRIWDYDRRDSAGSPRELHTELAKEAIDYKVYPDYKTDYCVEENLPTPLIDCPYFNSNLYIVDQQTAVESSSKDSFVILICLEGEGVIETPVGAIEYQQGKTILIPAAIEKATIVPAQKSKILEVSID